MKIYFKDLPCYQNLSKEQMAHSLYVPNQAFNLERLPETEIRSDFAAFIFDRALKISYLSLRSELTHFHNLADFLSNSYPKIEHLTDFKLPDLEKKLKMYLLKEGKPLTKDVKKLNNTYKSENPLFSYLRTAYEYFTPTKDFSFDNDVWVIDSLPFKTRDSPIRKLSNLSFFKISQNIIKEEVKNAVIYHLKRLSVWYVNTEIQSVIYLADFLLKNFPDIESFKDFDRVALEEYLSYLYAVNPRNKDYRSELYALKSILSLIGRIYSYGNLRGLFLKSDFLKEKKTVFRCYSDEELKRLHEGYKALDKQTARLLIIHELLGLRISDTLTLKKDNVFFTETPHIKIYQPKTGYVYEKKLSHELCKLLKASINETESTYGFCDYIFVSSADPKKPLPYSSLSYRFKAMVNRLNLLDDNGLPFTFTSHLFRHTYGKKLCDLFTDDVTIASLLGHKGVGSVKYYREMSPKVLLDNTKPVIDMRNEKIKQFKKGWME